jgi:hypothetical protein
VTGPRLAHDVTGSALISREPLTEALKLVLIFPFLPSQAKSILALVPVYQKIWSSGTIPHCCLACLAEP